MCTDSGSPLACHSQQQNNLSRRALLLTAVGAVTGAAAFRWAGTLVQDRHPFYGPETRAGWHKYAGNPVLGGKLGTCFDVCLLREADIFRMWFSWRPSASIGMVESKDGIRWNKPTVALAPPGPRWELAVNRPIVLRASGAYHMWYTGQSGGTSTIGHATSPDGRVWEPSPFPVLRPELPWEKSAVMCPDVLWNPDEHRYEMWYSAGDQFEPDAIGYATSQDGNHWTRLDSTPIFKPDPRHPWEAHKVTACQVVRDGDWHIMFYIGFADPHTARIGLARSLDGIHAWQRHPQNPIIQPSSLAGSWDYDAVYKPFAIRMPDHWRLWYNGRRGSVEQIGLAIHPGTNLGFD